ncbi:MAG: ABC transporter permease subunit [Chloroflexota bacterium]
MAVQALDQPATSSRSATLSNVLTRTGLLFGINGFGLWFAIRAFAEGFISTGAVMILILAGLNYVILVRDMYPLRWMAIGLVFLAMFSIYPVVLTVIVAFTNFGDGHLLTKQQSIEQNLKQRYLPAGGAAYTWTGYINENDEYALWLQNDAGESFLAIPGIALIPAADAAGVEGLDDDGIPDAVQGFERLNALQVASNSEIQNIQFGTELDGVQIRSTREAAQLSEKFEYIADQDALLDLETNTLYFPEEGNWVAENRDELPFGFQANVGFKNFVDFVQSPALRGPLLRIIIWNFLFAFFSVFLTFSLGLTIAYIFDDPDFPGRKVIQSLLLIPYTIPSLITIIIWRGMFNNQVGVINRILESLFGIAPAWTVDPTLAKIAILIVNLWLGYPYFMLICTGALQAIPKDLYAAAKVDGATPLQQFFNITLPILLVAVGPLLVFSFTYNFNNFNLIFLFIEGGPPIAGAATRAGHTDILISYVYNLAFAAGRQKVYGLASAATIIIFFIVAVITLVQFRYTQMWEEVSENV